MKKAFARLATLALASCALVVGITAVAQQQPNPAPRPTPEAIARGERLVGMLGCKDCHTPLGQDGKPIPGRELTGHPENVPLPKWDPTMIASHNAIATFGVTATAFAGPWGVSVAGNLTPDMETGIGKLTLDQLKESFRSYKHWKFDNRPVLPPMPHYKDLNDEEVTAIYSYLMSRPPVKNKTPLSVVAPGPGGK